MPATSAAEVHAIFCSNGTNFDGGVYGKVIRPRNVERLWRAVNVHSPSSPGLHPGNATGNAKVEGDARNPRRRGPRNFLFKWNKFRRRGLR
jgi:hypothetical protein